MDIFGSILHTHAGTSSLLPSGTGVKQSRRINELEGGSLEWKKGEGGRGTLHLTHLKRKTTRRKHKREREGGKKAGGTGVHVSAGGR